MAWFHFPILHRPTHSRTRNKVLWEGEIPYDKYKRTQVETVISPLSLDSDFYLFFFVGDKSATLRLF